ncbi:serine protease [Deinococcus malanensis]|uniref:Serine protease n=1 Tax=Deinococcus malanensis TaxID=1706855 RepID=A0ABQ2F1U6_9DEIO|nr:S1C family serine protease [Deinococcus malanensis]GGK42134.1 serine protease [Deinococcus malanensis]
MNSKWTAACRGAVLTATLQMAGTVDARTNPIDAGTSSVLLAQAAPEPLNVQEKNALAALFKKLRPATLRIEDCPPDDCTNPEGIATAFLIGDGYALTAFHVIEGQKNLSAVTLDKRRYPLQIIGFDDHSDVALIRVGVPVNTPFIPLAAAAPRVGEPVLTIGNGNGAFLGSKMGRLTGLDRGAERAEFPAGTLEFNARVLPGDSGGPLINARGEVVGVVSYIRLADGRGSRITAYAVPVTQTGARMAGLRGGLRQVAPTTGLHLDSHLDYAAALPPEEFGEFSDEYELDLGTTPGAFFTRVAPGSPAERAGLQPLDFDRHGKRISGDLVIAVNGQRINNFLELQFAVRRYQAGEAITLSVLRNGRTLVVTLVLVPRTDVRGTGSTSN